jgi:predicted PurR-regulated permease PerM
VTGVSEQPPQAGEEVEADGPQPPDARPDPPEPDEPDHDHDPLPPEVAPWVVPRWVQHVALPLAILAIWVLIWAAGEVLLLFLAAAVIALILNPAVTFFHERLRFPRGLAVPAVYICFFAFLVGLGFALSGPISEQVSKFQDDIPHIADSANKTLANLQQWLNDQGIHVQIVKQGKTALQTLQEKAGAGAGSIVNFGGDLLTRLVTAGFQLVLVFVL